jgi:hypothetical protein
VLVDKEQIKNITTKEVVHCVVLPLCGIAVVALAPEARLGFVLA